MLTKLYKKPGIQVEECYCIETCAPLSAEQLVVIKHILADGFVAGTVTSKPFFTENEQIVKVGPRLSFATPASSNLVTQCHACGILQITRIEKFLHYKYACSNEKAEIIARHDRMTEREYTEELISLDSGATPEQVWEVDMIAKGPGALLDISGLPFDKYDRQRYHDYFVGDHERNPTCVEIYDLANADSNHSRHHDFKARNVIDGEEMPETFFDIVRSTWEANPGNSVIAFHDNASAIQGFECWAMIPENPGRVSRYVNQKLTYHILFTAETHNFPSGVAPYPGAETGLGGWIRDAVCAGKGSLVLHALAGYCVGRLCIPGLSFAWEDRFSDFKYPHNLASPLEIAIKASNGVSDYGNCFGVPTKGGFFRSFGSRLPNGRRVEFVKPIVYVGGGGIIDDRHTEKGEAIKGLRIVQIGGPAFNVGFGGGAASSMHQGENEEKLDWDAVQRGDPEMERKAYEVIKACVDMGIRILLVSAHDQGAGGPGNVLKELVEKAGGIVYLDKINLGDPTLSALQIWVAEYQERFAFLIKPEDMDEFRAICEREDVNCEDLGEVTGDGRFTVVAKDGSKPVDIDLDFVLGNVPQKTFYDERVSLELDPVSWPEKFTFFKALIEVLKEPSVACKSWLVDKVDRHVLGRTALQQGVGPLGLPLADCNITALSYFSKVGYATALGEQPYKLMVNPAAGARMTFAEMLTNMVWALITDIAHIKCSANWMCAPKVKGERAAMYDAAIGLRDLMIKLRVAIDGGKDSLSMATIIFEEIVTSLRQLVIGGYVSMRDITKFVTPDIKRPGDSLFVLVDPSKGQCRLGGSVFAHVMGGQIGKNSPDIEYPELLLKAFQLTQTFIRDDLILSGHDRSDGGLIVSLLEMAFGGNCGLELDIIGSDGAIRHMFAEEAGLIYEIAPKDEDQVLSRLYDTGLPAQVIGKSISRDIVSVKYNGSSELLLPMTTLREQWMLTSMHMEAQQSKADNPMAVAMEKYTNINGIEAAPVYKVPFIPKATAPEIMKRAKKYPTMILRDEGTNGHEEMIAAARLAGLDPYNVHMTDLLSGRASMDDFLFLIIPGGFSHKDVPQSGKGFAAKIRFNEKVWNMLQRFIARPNTLSAGVCNGCQVNTLLGLVPWHGIEPHKQPRMIRNKSGMFESPWVHLRVNNSPSVLHRGMAGMVFGAWVAHGEGQFYFPDQEVFNQVRENNLITMQYVDHNGEPTQKYPMNPNGSPLAIAGLTTPDGRHTVCMPHPIDRSFYPWQCPWLPEEFKKLEVTPWLKMYQNARQFFEEY